MLDDPRKDTVLATLAFAAVDELLVLCYGAVNPSEEDWDLWLARETLFAHQALLIVTDGGAPNAGQRARVANAIRTSRARPPVALLTDSMFHRTLMTAFTWVLGMDHPMRAFPRGGLAEALEWLPVRINPERVRSVVQRLRSALAK